MATIIGTDISGQIRLVVSGSDASSMPTTFNGTALTATVLTGQQEAALNKLQPNRGGTMFDGVTLTAMPAPIPAAVAISQLDAFLAALAADPMLLAKIKALK